MKYLFNSKGEHIANEVNGHLHATTGQNIGHYLVPQEIFIDMNGHYLGELVFDNRLVQNNSSPYKFNSFGSYGNYGNVGNYGNPGNCGNVGLSLGYVDIDPKKLT